MNDYFFLKTLSPLRLEWIHQCLQYHSLKIKHLNILDIGCGPGFIALPLWEKGGSITAIDINKQALDTLKVKSCQFFHEKVGSLHCIEGSIETIIFPKKSFDIILLMDSLEHLSHPHDILESLFSWLKPGGLLLGSTMNKTLFSLFHGIYFAEYIAHLVPKGTHDYDLFIRPQDLDNTLKNIGFSTIQFQGFCPKRYSPFSLLEQTQWCFCSNLRMNYFFKGFKEK